MLGVAAAVVIVSATILWSLYQTEQADDQELDKPTFTRISIPTYPGNGVLSPDGEQLAFVSGGIVWTVPLHGKVDPNLAGQPVRLTEQISAWNRGTINLMAWSDNGKWIAFNACLLMARG